MIMTWPIFCARLIDSAELGDADRDIGVIEKEEGEHAIKGVEPVTGRRDTERLMTDENKK
jgi:hypothetical protein